MSTHEPQPASVYTDLVITVSQLLTTLKPFATTADQQCHTDCSGNLTQADWERAAQQYNELKERYPHGS